MPNNRSLQANPDRLASNVQPRLARAPQHVGAENFPVIGMGASAGGLDACAKLLDALPLGIGMAFILVQHLDPMHESMMAELLANHTSLIVKQAADGMPRSALMTGSVDLVLPLASIPDALARFRRMILTHAAAAPDEKNRAQDCLPQIIDLLRTRTLHDFRLYKEGTLRRRIERRMAVARIEIDGMERYLDLLRKDEDELQRLATDLLINVTSFFRDPKVFGFLAETIIPDLVRSHSIDQPLRIWIAGCSTGEETYSLAILFREEITAAKREIKLQIFASDVDADAVATARDGLYPETIGADVSPARLVRFFSKDDHGYRILPELRATIVFAVQDVLADPPFSRLDLISCRNLLI